MAENSGSNSHDERRRSLRGLLFWLGLLPLVLGSLFCCAQLALFSVPGRDWSSDTRSRLMADYQAWGYQVIPPLRLAELIKDIEQDELMTGTPRPVITAVYWVPPTPTSTAYSVAQITETATPGTQSTSTRTPEGPLNTPIASRTPAASPTLTLLARTYTPTTAPSATSTATRPPVYLPTSTNTPRPEPTDTRPAPTNTPVTPSATPVTPSRTPVPPSATPVTPSATQVTPSATPVTPSPTPVTPTPVTPSPTPITPSPTFTPETPTFTPTYAPVWPIEEYDGLSTPVAGGGCVASFGYRNDNPQAVDIPVSLLNQISVDTAIITPAQPTHFLVGRITGAFEVFWNTEGPLFWALDGRLASAAWCATPTTAVP